MRIKIYALHVLVLIKQQYLFLVMERLRSFYKFSSIALKSNSLSTKFIPNRHLSLQWQKNLLVRSSTNKICYHFCQKQSKPNKDPQTKIQNEAPDQKVETNKNEQAANNSGTKQVQNLNPEQLFNLFLGLDKNHSFKNDLIVAQNKYNKEIKQLREAILFEDLLKKEIDILVYDTQGKPFFQDLFKTFLRLVSIVGTIFFFLQGLKTDKKIKVSIEKTPEGRFFTKLVGLMCGCLLIVTLIKHLRMCKRYVQKIVYHTEDETFTFVKRRAYGKKYEEKVSRFKILYTQNPALIKRGTNYLNIENQTQYRIGYTFAWKKEDLFSHLISQRIRT